MQAAAGERCRAWPCDLPCWKNRTMIESRSWISRTSTDWMSATSMSSQHPVSPGTTGIPGANHSGSETRAKSNNTAKHELRHLSGLGRRSKSSIHVSQHDRPRLGGCRKAWSLTAAPVFKAHKGNIQDGGATRREARCRRQERPSRL